MEKASLRIDKDARVASIDERLYGSFIEHLGRAVYTGIYEPAHPTADGQGFRGDVLALVRELKVPIVRYPGGNFLSGYDWTDGIGPRDRRPTRLDLAWKTIEPNEIGIDEFHDWAKKAGASVLGAVNMGTGTPKDAGNLVEYCNFPGGTRWSDLRRENGHSDPLGIKTWCVGNEMDGAWQICHLDAADYGKKARETAKIMKWVDDSIELVVSGSSSSRLPSFPEWDRIVLEHAYEYADYVSLHQYYENFGNDADFLASFHNMDRFIKTVCATADYVKALKRSDKTMMLSFDEWNVWYQRQQKPHDWERAPDLLEDRYSLLDALVVGGLGITLLNNADRVRIACLAQLVNVIAPILTEPNGRVIRQTTFYPFRDLSRFGRGVALRAEVRAATIETTHGDAPTVTAAAALDEKANALTVFVLNANLSAEVSLGLDLRSFGKIEMTGRSVLAGPDLGAVNTFERPNAVVPADVAVERGSEGTFSPILAPASWNVFRFSVGK